MSFLLLYDKTENPTTNFNPSSDCAQIAERAENARIKGKHMLNFMYATGRDCRHTAMDLRQIEVHGDHNSRQVLLTKTDSLTSATIIFSKTSFKPQNECENIRITVYIF